MRIIKQIITENSEILFIVLSLSPLFLYPLFYSLVLSSCYYTCICFNSISVKFLQGVGWWLMG